MLAVVCALTLTISAGGKKVKVSKLPAHAMKIAQVNPNSDSTFVSLLTQALSDSLNSELQSLNDSLEDLDSLITLDDGFDTVEYVIDDDTDISDIIDDDAEKEEGESFKMGLLTLMMLNNNEACEALKADVEKYKGKNFSLIDGTRFELVEIHDNVKPAFAIFTASESPESVDTEDFDTNMMIFAYAKNDKEFKKLKDGQYYYIKGNLRCYAGDEHIGQIVSNSDVAEDDTTNALLTLLCSPIVISFDDKGFVNYGMLVLEKCKFEMIPEEEW